MIARRFSVSILIRYLFRSASLIAFLVGASTAASASMLVAVCNDSACAGGDDIVVQDNGAGDNIGAAGGTSTSLAAFGYSLVVNTSQSKPIVGSAAAPQLDLNFTATTNDSLAHSIFLFV